VTLHVRLHGRRIGRLEQDQASVVSFHLDEAYIEENRRPVLGQFFEDHGGWAVYRMQKHPGRLPAFFSNLLPEGGLRELVEAVASARDEMSLIDVVGLDLPGAVTVGSDGSRQAPGEGPSGAPARQPTVLEEPGNRDALPPSIWRFSLAGVQLKFSAVRSPNGRFTLPFRGEGGRWILKFGSTQYPELVENEFATMSWAARCGIDVPQHRLVPVSDLDDIDQRFLALGPNVFAIERFDRPPSGARIHQEDFAQVRCVLPEFKYGSKGYEGIGRLIADLCGEDDLLEYVRRLTFMIMSGNTDAHLKNWSFIYPDQRQARLSPAYDLVCVRQYNPADKLALPFANETIPEAIKWEHFRRLERFLAKFGHVLPVVDTARALVNAALEAWNAPPVLGPPHYRRAINEHLAALPLARR
jgi:serine/threonine-protein kinase HipA